MHMERYIGGIYGNARSPVEAMGKRPGSLYRFIAAGGGVRRKEYGHGEIYERLFFFLTNYWWSGKLGLAQGIWPREMYERFFFDKKRLSVFLGFGT